MSQAAEGPRGEKARRGLRLGRDEGGGGVGRDGGRDDVMRTEPIGQARAEQPDRDGAGGVAEPDGGGVADPRSGRVLSF